MAGAFPAPAIFFASPQSRPLSTIEPWRGKVLSAREMLMVLRCFPSDGYLGEVDKATSTQFAHLSRSISSSYLDGLVAAPGTGPVWGRPWTPAARRVPLSSNSKTTCASWGFGAGYDQLSLIRCSNVRRRSTNFAWSSGLTVPYGSLLRDSSASAFSAMSRHWSADFASYRLFCDLEIGWPIFATTSCSDVPIIMEL